MLGAGGGTLFLPINEVSVVVMPPDLSVTVTLIRPSGNVETSTTAPNVPSAPTVPVPDTEYVPSVNLKLTEAPGAPVTKSGTELAPGVFVPDGRFTPWPDGSDSLAAPPTGGSVPGERNGRRLAVFITSIA